ncbi:CPBP family intramembrane metalloprotease [bacterium]|nr:CPBP family intramembrane metalloprotease [bacterium]
MAEKKVNIKLVALLALLGLLIAMVAAPWVFRVTSQLDITKDYIFRKIFNRVFLVSEVLVFLAFWKKLGIEIPYKIYYKRQHIKNEFGSWFLVAILTIALMTVIQYFAGFRHYQARSWSYILSKGAVALLSSFVVALMEETIFRGLLFSSFKTRFRSMYSALFTSLIFASLHIFSLDHFLKSIKVAQANFVGTDPLAGFYHMALFMKPLCDWQVIIPGFIGLFICSLMLCGLTMKTGCLWPAIATHFGWVFTIKITGRIWPYDKEAAAATGMQWLLGEKFVATGVLGWIIVIIETAYVVGLIGYSVYLVLKWICSKISIDSCYKMADFFGNASYYLCLKKRAIAIDNIKHAFLEKSDKEARSIAKASFRNLARVAVGVLIMPRLLKRVPSGFESMHYDRVAKAHTMGPGGIVYFTAHYGNWESQSWTSTLLGGDFTAVGRPFRNKLVYRDIARKREAVGLKLVNKKEAIRPLIKTLRRGGEVGLVADQYAGKGGVPTLFMGRVCSTTNAAAALARLTHCPIVPAFCRELPDHHFQAYIYEPFFVAETDDPEKDIREATQRCMDCLELEIRRAPENYLWAHRKWRRSYTKLHPEIKEK